MTTHFEFKYLHDTLLKLDELGHDMPTFYKYFEEYTGIPIDSIPMNDPKVYSLLTSPESAGRDPGADRQPRHLRHPEMGTNFVRGMLVEGRPSREHRCVDRQRGRADPQRHLHAAARSSICSPEGRMPWRI